MDRQRMATGVIMEATNEETGDVMDHDDNRGNANLRAGISSINISASAPPPTTPTLNGTLRANFFVVMMLAHYHYYHHHHQQQQLNMPVPVSYEKEKVSDDAVMEGNGLVMDEESDVIGRGQVSSFSSEGGGGAVGPVQMPDIREKIIGNNTTTTCAIREVLMMKMNNATDTTTATASNGAARSPSGNITATAVANDDNFFAPIVHFPVEILVIGGIGE